MISIRLFGGNPAPGPYSKPADPIRIISEALGSIRSCPSHLDQRHLDPQCARAPNRTGQWVRRWMKRPGNSPGSSGRDPPAKRSTLKKNKRARRAPHSRRAVPFKRRLSLRACSDRRPVETQRFLLRPGPCAVRRRVYSASMPGKMWQRFPGETSGPGEYTRITTRAELEAEQAARDKARAEQAPPAPLAARRGFAIGLAIGGAALVIAIIVVLVIVLRKH